MADPKRQVENFKDAARELGTDEDEARFDEKLKRIVKAPLPNRERERGKINNPTSNSAASAVGAL